MRNVTIDRQVFDKAADPIRRDQLAERLFAFAATVAGGRNVVTHAVVLGIVGAASIVVVLS